MPTRMELKTPYKDVLPGLSKTERSTLEASIRENGVLSPVIIDEDGNILDGHNRYEIQPDAPTQVVSGLSEAEKVAFVLSANLARRNLSPAQVWELRETQKALALELKQQGITQQQIAELLGVTQQCVAKWLDISNTTGCKADIPDARVKLTPDAKPVVMQRLADGDTQAEIASDYKVSQATISSVAKEFSTLNELRDRVAASLSDDNLRDQWEVFFYGPDKFDIKKAQRLQVELEMQQRVKDGASVSQLYDVIVVDPPWPMEKIEREVAPNQVGFDYATMTLDEIKEFDAVRESAADDCHLFVWTTQKFLPPTLGIIEAWGFRYVLTMVWHKNGGFQPFNLPQYNCEFAIYARKGSPEFINTKAFNCCFKADRTGHSAKPEEFYELLRRVTDGKRLDIFNRRKIEGFTGWGNESNA